MNLKRIIEIVNVLIWAVVLVLVIMLAAFVVNRGSVPPVGNMAAKPNVYFVFR